MLDDAGLMAAWEELLEPNGYTPPTEQELADLADSRHRKRGQATRNARIKNNNEKLRNHQDAAAEARMPPTDKPDEPAVPPAPAVEAAPVPPESAPTDDATDAEVHNPTIEHEPEQSPMDVQPCTDSEIADWRREPLSENLPISMIGFYANRVELLADIGEEPATDFYTTQEASWAVRKNVNKITKTAPFCCVGVSPRDGAFPTPGQRPHNVRASRRRTT